MSSHIGVVQVPRALVATLAVVMSLSARPVVAQTWIGGSGANWNTASNWSPAVIPNSPTAAVSFTGIALGNVNISSSVQAQSLTFSNPTGSYTLSSSAGVILSGVTTINVAAGVTNQQTIQIAPNSGGSLLFPSANNLTINNNSTAPGVTLHIGQLTVIGTPGTGSVIVNGSGTTEIEGTFASLASGNHIVNGLTKNGTGTLILSNPNNYYIGGTRINSGVVSIPTIANGGLVSPIGADSSNPANLVLGGGTRATLQFTGANTLYSTNRGLTVEGLHPFNGGGAIRVQNASTLLSVEGQITGTGSLIKTGPGKLGLVNTTNNYSGGTYVEAGTLVIGTSGAVLPPNRDVTVFGGGTLELAFSPGSNNGNPIGSLNLDGGTFRIVPGAGPVFFLNRLTTGLMGGAIDLSGSTGILRLTGAGSSISVNGNSTWFGGTGFPSGIVGDLGLNTEFFIASGVTVTNGALLYNDFRITGGGTLYMNTPVNNVVAFYTVSQGRVRVDSLPVGSIGPTVLGAIQPGFLTLDGGTLQYAGPTASSEIPIAFGQFGGGVEVSNAGTTLTLAGTIAAASGGVAGPLVKSGPGSLILNNTANTYSGGITVNDGRLDVGADSQLGAANPQINGFGTLRFTASTTTGRTFTLNNGTLEVPSGVTLAMNGARASGGFLRGAGTYSLGGNSALTGVTTFTNTNLNVTGPASITNFAHNGNLTVNSGQTLTMNYGTNGSAGRMTINGTANVTEFVSNGLLTVPNGGLINNTHSNMVLGGGSTTFVGSVANPGGKIDLGGQQLLVRGGLLVTNAGSFGSGNGVRNGQVVADFGALVKGTGPYQSVITQNGGQYLPGNSPGTSQVGDFFINPGGNLIFQITDAGPSVTFPSAPGTAGNNPGWGLTQVFTSLTFSATPSNPYTITMQTQLPPPAAPDTPGAMSSFDPNNAYQWLIFDLQPGAVFNGTFDPSAISFATSQFVNSTAGGTFSLTRNGGQIFLTFTPVPEPVWILAFSAVAIASSSYYRRIQRRSANDLPIGS